MKKKFFYSLFVLSSITAALFTFFGFSKGKDKLVDPTTPIYQYSIKGIDGKMIDLKQFKGKKVMFVNVASECGFTKQYKDLEELHEKYGSKLVIIGFPCNQFGGQEPGTEKEIAAFCTKNFGVTFLLTEKIEVKGANQHPIYKWLTSKSLNGKTDSEVKWNFQKYIINEQGQFVDFFYSMTNPMSDKITSLL